MKLRIASVALYLCLGCIVVSVAAGPEQSVEDPAAAERPVYDADAAALLDELVVLARRPAWDVGDTLRATYLALRVSAKGSAAVPYARQRFLDAGLPEDGFLSAAFVALHGQMQDLVQMRSTLETSAAKQAWLRDIVGDEKAMTTSLRAGLRWQDIPSRIPAALRGRTFALVCLRSDDALVRRAGLYFGFWLCGEDYDRAAREAALHDPDPLTRRYARYLIGVRSKLAN